MLSNLPIDLAQYLDITSESDLGDAANDNRLGFHYVDLETDHAANDNGEHEEIFDEELCDDPRFYEYVEAVDGRLDGLLTAAGYDPEVIPTEERHTAFEVSLCVAKGIFDAAWIAEALCFTRAEVRHATRLLRLAAKPGTKVG